jgi:hypothetical protein
MTDRIRYFAANPVLIILTSLFAALVVSYTSAVYLPYSAWSLFYNIPVGVAFLIFAFDRLQTLGMRPLLAYALDGALIAAAVTRMFVLVPIYSGHSLFLTYFLVTANTRLARLTAFAVLVQVAIVKWVLADWTFVGGVVLGVVAGLGYQAIVSMRAARLERSFD